MIFLGAYLLIGAIVGLITFIIASSDPVWMQKALADEKIHVSTDTITILVLLASLCTILIWPVALLFVILVKNREVRND